MHHNTYDTGGYRNWNVYNRNARGDERAFQLLIDGCGGLFSVAEDQLALLADEGGAGLVA